MASKTAPSEIELAPHPVRRGAHFLLTFAAVIAFAGLGLASLGASFELPTMSLAFAGVLGALGGWTLIAARAVQAHNKAYNWITTGRLDDAEALLERHATAIRWSGYGRALDLQR